MEKISCGGFYLGDNLSIENVDGKEVLNATGGWPEDLPLPSEGGYGYTDEDETVHKIDSKYLPESVFLVSFSSSDGKFVSDKTFDQIKSAYNMGLTVRGDATGTPLKMEYITDDINGKHCAFATHQITRDPVTGSIEGLGYMGFDYNDSTTAWDIFNFNVYTPES